MYKPAPLRKDHKKMILLDRRAALGDVIMTTPVIRELRRRYPEAHIQVVTDEPAVLANNPDVSRVVLPSQMEKKDPWDIYINLNNAYETQVSSHYIESYLDRAFGESRDQVTDRDTAMYPSDDEKAAVDEALAEHKIKDYIVVHMRRWAWENKNIDFQIWSALFTRLQDKYPDVTIISIGAKYDMRVPVLPGYADLVEQLSLGEIQYLISGARAFIGPDSGPFHIAGTTRTPIVALISHLLPEQILPWRDGEFGKDITVVLSGVPCVGCYARQTPPVNNLTCENDVQWACNKAFDNLEMFRAMEAILDK
jgi:ADP-heptose:LPS heptosyltransferase